MLFKATDCTYVYFILSSVFYVIVAVCQLLIKDFLILILILNMLAVLLINHLPGSPVKHHSHRARCVAASTTFGLLN